jgi:type II secretory ATPase GspE/PulE/Tfp pilus assembly ATPase PilB-like protein
MIMFYRRLSSANPARSVAPTFASLSTQDDIARMTPAFVRVLNEEFDMAALSGRLCPVALKDGTVAIFVLADYLAGDQIDEVERMIIQRGRALANPARYVVPAPLLLSVARGQLTLEHLCGRRVVLSDRNHSALTEAFYEIVAWGVRHDASDVHLNLHCQRAESEIRYTIGGSYVAPERFYHMPTATLMEMLAVVWMDVRGGNGAVFDPKIEQQGRLNIEIEGQPIMLRWASLATDAGPAVCLRVLRVALEPEYASLCGLGYLPAQVEVLERAGLSEGGAIVLAGVVGSGKSTTIASLIRTLPKTRKVITLEDPVEYLISNALQNTMVRNLEEGDAANFAAKLKTIKRCAMNDLLIGEIRDTDTGRALMDLAGSGVNIYTTTHAMSAQMIPERLTSDFIGISRDFLATPGVLKLLVYQALLPALCAQCALPFESLYQAEDAEKWHVWAHRFTRLYGLDIQKLRVRNTAGCGHCEQAELPHLRGTQGRTVVAEMIEPEQDEVFLDCVRTRDNLRMRRHLYNQRRSAFDHADMEGKSAMECAIYKASLGQIDPREIEPRFKSFVTIEREQAAWKNNHA